MSKTPQFNSALAEILDNLQPHAKTCKQCNVNFDIFIEDIEMYKKLQVPPPTLCPDCRMQRLMGNRINFLPIFYKKTCSVPGHSEKIISLYSEKNPIKVYDDNFYISDQWDALEFGKDYDLNQSFFAQFKDLILKAPHQSLQRDLKSINCEYTVSGTSSKNCYYVSTPWYSENVYYGRLPARSKDCMEVLNVNDNEGCYEGVSSDHCYNCVFYRNSANCMDSYFIFDCKNCSNCFGCSNLRNKQYCFFNEQLSKEDYENKLKAVDLGKHSVFQEFTKKFTEKIFLKAIRKNLYNIKIENSIGNGLHECRDCFYVFDNIKGPTENLRYCASLDKCNNSMDVSGASNIDLVYESVGIFPGNFVKFSNMIRGGQELEYCLECNNCAYCFGCVSLKNKKYCIFNKQYIEEEYWQKIDEIKSEMLKVGEYGEFFPLANSPFPYGDSNASIEFPLSKEKVNKNGWHLEEGENDIDLSKFQIINAKNLPDDIKDVSDDILNKVIICEKTGKPFKITKFEFDFYRVKNLPLPTVHPLQRIKDRFESRLPFKLWQYPCSNCGQIMYSGYDPDKNYKVYCEECYLREIV